MKRNYTIVAVSVLAGVVVWMGDVLIDYFFFFDMSFKELLVKDASTHETFTRALTAVSFMVFVLVLANVRRIHMRAREEARSRDVALKNELRHAQKMQALGTLTAGVAHDFSNLLVAIFGYTDLAKATLPDGHAAIRSLQMVEEAARQAKGVTNALLAFSRKSVAAKNPVDLRSVIADSMRLFRCLLPSTIKIAGNTWPARGVWVDADPTQLQQLLMNLVVNARDAMPEGGCLRVVLTEETVQEDAAVVAGEAPGAGAWAQIVVSDTGVGMSNETMSRVLEPFFTTRSRKHGVGLGLAIAHGIVTDHRGSLEVESELGKGTRVTVKLPSCEPPSKNADGRAAPCIRAGRGEMIVLVDSNQQVRSIITSTLRRHGYQVAQAGTVAEATGLLDTYADAVKLVMLDLDLADRSGPSGVRRIRGLRPDLPVLVVVGPADLGVEGWSDPNITAIRKPFQMSELTHLVEQVLGGAPLVGGVSP